MTNNDNRTNGAHAPYNFIPLPDRVVNAEPVPDHDQYHANRHTGYFDVTLITKAPLYIRGMLTEQEAIRKKDPEIKNKPEFFQLNGQPIIPGSSLRGMLRALVEIITFSKMTRVSDKPKIFFRAVTSPKNDPDPLNVTYVSVIGDKPLGGRIRAGYLRRQGDNWFIHPASTREGKTFIKVRDLDKEGSIVADARSVDGLIHLNNKYYRPQYHDVVIDGEVRNTKSGPRASVRSPRKGEKRQGVLVCTGNMAESATPQKDGSIRTERKNFTLVFEADIKEQPFQISPQAVTNYMDGLTPFQKEQPFDENFGCLIEGRPIFYIPPTQNELVSVFGHAPFSRIPAMIKDKDGHDRAVTPHDFIPPTVADNATQYDMAETMFGYIDKGTANQKQGTIARSYASRVAVTDARLVDGQMDYFERSFTPKILEGPKPTTFQHYLQQTTNDKPSLKHYASGTQNTKIRGRKLYWRQKGVTISQIEETDQEALRKIAERNDTQHTKMKPVRKCVRFAFRVYFENLSAAELGALAWAITLRASPDHRHQLGMGKPYGMGTVKLNATLTITDRTARYRSLFDNQGWNTGAEPHDPTTYIEVFEKGIMTALGKPTGKFLAQEVIKDLCVMLTPQAPDSETFSYMQIEGPKGSEYKDRPVLKRPSEFAPGSVPAIPQIEIPVRTLIPAKVVDPKKMTVRLSDEYGGLIVTLPPEPTRGIGQPITLVKDEGSDRLRVASKDEQKTLKK